MHGLRRAGPPGRVAAIQAHLAFVLLLAAPALARGQSVVQVAATPATFTSGATITVEASVTPGASPEAQCFAWDACHIIWGQPFLHVWGPHGFSAYADDWTLQASDPTPGQLLQGGEYVAYGGVTWLVCWGFTYCVEHYEYGEAGWSAPATVTATAAPTADWVAPATGAGPSQTFTVRYTSAAGAAGLAPPRTARQERL